MPFWKKSEDPWDYEPERRDPVRREEEPPVSPDGETQDRSAYGIPFQSRDAGSQSPPPMACPWCGQEMEVGYVTGGRDAVRWWPGWPPRMIGGADGAAIRVDHEGTVFLRYKTAYLCRACRRMVLEFPEEALEADTWETPPAENGGEQTAPADRRTDETEDT